MRTHPTIKQYNPPTVKAQPWPEIELHYVDLNKHGLKLEPVLELVRHIIASGIATRLFASTSLSKLIVSIYNPLEWNRETLHIELDAQQKWHFSYFAKPDKPVEFEREYPKEKGIEKFDSFVKMINW